MVLGNSMRSRIVMAALGLMLVSLPLIGTWAAKPGAESGYVVVKLKSPAAVYYRGGINNIPATAPRGGRFDPNSNAYAAYSKHLKKQQRAFRAKLATHAPNASPVRSFRITANAVVVKLNGESPDKIRNIRGVKKVHDSPLYRPNMNESVGLINAPPAWTAVGGQSVAGEGIRIAVIDSGIVDSLIPGFHEFYACKSVEFGNFYFSGQTGTPAIGIKNENGAEPAPGVAYDSTHGTHVAGTAGGCVTTIGDGSIWDGTSLSGVAPGATLVDYNVFPGIGAGWTAFGGSAFSHDIAAAIEDAVANGDHIINMSLGGDAQGPNDFLAAVSGAAMKAGVVVVTSAGNEGPGDYTIGSPGTHPAIITVGATTNTRGLTLTVTAPGFDPIKGYAGEFPDFDGSDETLVDWPGSDNLACTSDVADGSLAGEVVLIERGACTFSQKMHNAKAAGAGGAVVFTDSRDPGAMARSPGFDDEIPAVMVGRDDGLALEAELASVGSLFPTVIIPPTIGPETPNELAGFSSRGPAPFTEIVKPDVVAPGVNILSSVFTGTGWELFDGTSMASPHVAGASAVLLQSHPDWSPAQVKSALATTATDLGLAPWEQGSGLINLEAANNTNAFFKPTNASFGRFTGRAPADGSITIKVDSAASCSVNSVSGDYVSASIDGTELTVEFAGGRSAAGAFYGGFVSVDCGGQSHTIPWGAVVNR
jgi:minor extracellular serine protease Vpr